ncbi:MAG: SCP2 sterol-binding domain-containing protein [Sedimenticola sp.]|nr:SCP2 sterol-binding domain-containing protein [Sedimenticola sp.]MCW8946831.1 SCP2 sterol-binding domain-containing protein [Sedimenticola sp.]
MSNATNIPENPHLPAPLALPLSLVPSTSYSSIMVKVLNKLFAPELADGELDFLNEKVMRVDVVDARLSFSITLRNGSLCAAGKNQPHDLSIEGSIYDFLLLATRREDADTLFFNRRLRLGGDTELGLYVKNFLDALELDERIGPFLKMLDGMTTLISRLPSLPKPAFKLPLPKLLRRNLP